MTRLGLLAALAVAGGNAVAAPMPAPPPVRPVTETLYGRQVTDPYRYMEALGPETTGWMKAQGAYTRDVFASIPNRAGLLKGMADLVASFAPVLGFESYGGVTVYEERAADSDNFDLMVRGRLGPVRKLVDVAALRAANGGVPFAINYFELSPDGAKVAVGVSQGGSEDASISVYDTASGRVLAGPVDRGRFGAISWTDDGAELFLNRLAAAAPGASRNIKYFNSTAQVWDLKSKPLTLFGGGASGAAIKPGAATFPTVKITPGSPVALAAIINGVQNEAELWTTPITQAASPNAPWRKLVGFDDGVTSVSLHGSDIYLLSHQDAPTFKVMHLRVGQPLASAEVVVPAKTGRLIEQIATASDGLYVQTREGVYSKLLRIPYGGGAAQEVALPVQGSITSVFADPRRPGAVMLMEGWTTPPTYFAYDPSSGHFADLKLGGHPAFDSAALSVEDLHAKAKDGVEVPLSYVKRRGTSGPQILLLDAYGSYGISEFPAFSPRLNYFALHGGTYATCHVRGGGELGEAWRLGGKDADKPNTWRDLIACAQDLIARGETTSAQLFIVGGSAGGITMGRALEERPDLFAGVIDAVPAANTLRAEFSPNGPLNIPEFGTITTQAGFNNLYAMDSLAHVRAGTRYPAVLITTGLNDPRVDPWEPAKFAAALQATHPDRPVLLRVEEAAGHGIGSTKAQSDALWADCFSFVFWRSGLPGWAPTELSAP